jgi:hypothetical protein
MCGQQKKFETGTYIFKTTEIAYVVTELKLDHKTGSFTSKTNTNTSLRKFEEKLNGQYKLYTDTIVFNFKYSQYVSSPMFNCKEMGEDLKPCLCVDTLTLRNDSIISRDKKYIAKRK